MYNVVSAGLSTRIRDDGNRDLYGPCGGVQLNREPSGSVCVRPCPTAEVAFVSIITRRTQSDKQNDEKRLKALKRLSKNKFSTRRESVVLFLCVEQNKSRILTYSIRTINVTESNPRPRFANSRNEFIVKFRIMF